jgi:hypothetical protein
MGRQHGTGRIYVKYGSYYGRWRAPDGRYINRRLGKVRGRGEEEGLSRREADRLLRRLMEADQARPVRRPEERRRTVDDAADALRDRLTLRGARLSYRQNCESMQRVHITPVLGRRRLDGVMPDDVERLARVMLATGASPKTVRNVLTFLHAIFALRCGRPAARPPDAGVDRDPLASRAPHPRSARAHRRRS